MLVMMPCKAQRFLIVYSLLSLSRCLAMSSALPNQLLNRRQAIFTGSAISSYILSTGASESSDDLAYLSLKGRYEEMRFDKPLFNLPPSEAKYPHWFEGTWDVTADFGGYIFPNTKIKKDVIVASENTPGFKQLSIMSHADIGKPRANFKLRFPKRGNDIVEDKVFNLSSMMCAWLDKCPSVLSSEYAPERNSNRCSFLLSYDGSTTGRGTVRVELFTNYRETLSRREDIFLMNEYNRQVTIYRQGTNSIATELISDYQHFWEYRRNEDNNFKGYLITAGYLQPQDENFFQSPIEPIILYSYVLDFKRA